MLEFSKHTFVIYEHSGDQIQRNMIKELKYFFKL